MTSKNKICIHCGRIFNRDVYSKDNDLGFREDLLSHAKYHKENKIIEDNFK